MATQRKLLRTGAPLQISKRKHVIPLLYTLVAMWFIQTVVMSTPTLVSAAAAAARAPAEPGARAVYGTVILQYIVPTCYPGYKQNHVRNITRTMVYTTWAFAAVTACAPAPSVLGVQELRAADLLACTGHLADTCRPEVVPQGSSAWPAGQLKASQAALACSQPAAEQLWHCCRSRHHSRPAAGLRRSCQRP